MNTDPRIKHAVYVIDAFTTAVLADKVARGRVRQGVPPDLAARQTGDATMVAAGIGTIVLFQIGVLGFLLLAVIRMNPGAIVGAIILAAYGFVTIHGALIYIHIAPHRKTPRQQKLSHPLTIIALMLGWWPVFGFCFLIAAGIDKLLGLVP
jgi:hypothetical protein